MENMNELFAALSKCQSKMIGAIKDSNNPYYNSKYADLSSCWDACRGPLTENGLAIMQYPEKKESDGWQLKTILAHSSGQNIEFYHPIIMSSKGKNGELIKREDIQAFGLAITYARRYSLCSIIGIPQIDDDGETNMNREKLQSPTQEKSPVKENTNKKNNPIGNITDRINDEKKQTNFEFQNEKKGKELISSRGMIREDVKEKKCSNGSILYGITIDCGEGYPKLYNTFHESIGQYAKQNIGKIVVFEYEGILVTPPKGGQPYNAYYIEKMDVEVKKDDEELQF